MQSILKEHVLPRLAGLGNTALWLHFAEEAVAFERGLSPLRGLPMPAGSDELAESTEEPWTDGSCLELLARQPVSPCLSTLIHPCSCSVPKILPLNPLMPGLHQTGICLSLASLL